jgi:hypothetical protein
MGTFYFHSSGKQSAISGQLHGTSAARSNEPETVKSANKESITYKQLPESSSPAER